MARIRIHKKPTPEQAAAIVKAFADGDPGEAVTVCHPLAGFAGRREELKQALGRAGVPWSLVQALGWSSQGPAVATRVEKLKAVLDAAHEAQPDHPLFADTDPETNDDLAGSA